MNKIDLPGFCLVLLELSLFVYFLTCLMDLFSE